MGKARSVGRGRLLDEVLHDGAALFLFPCGRRLLASEVFRLLERLPLPARKSPYQRRRDDNGQQQVGRAEEPLATRAPTGQEDLDAIVARDARREQEEQYGLCLRQRPAAKQTTARDVEGEDQGRRREAEVVGNAERHHRVGEGEKEKGEQQGVGRGQSDDLAQDAKKEEDGVEGGGGEQQGREDLREVDPRGEDDQAVDLGGDPHEEGQQRVAVDVVGRRPVVEYQVGDGVEARDMEVAQDEFAIAVRDLGEPLPVATDDHRVEYEGIEEGAPCQSALLVSHPEKAEGAAQCLDDDGGPAVVGCLIHAAKLRFLRR